jgi:ubiquinone/menaquinone biosynthesis C-methylase UbiE
MYDLVGYGTMIADKGRTSAYARALEQLVTPDSVVLDIGTGAGIMALLACRAGAARVYAVEPAGIIDVAREAAAANGFANRIRFIQAMSTEIDLPEQVDGIVAEIHGVLPLFQQSVTSIVDARDRFLKTGGWIIPARETMWTAVVSSPRAHAEVVDPWNTEYAFDFSGAAWRAANQCRRRRFNASELATPPHCWATLDYAALAGPNVSGHISWTLERAAIGHGIAAWFDTEAAAGIGFSNSPSSEEHIFAEMFFPWPEAVQLATGDKVAVQLRADLVGSSYVWSWKTEVTGSSSEAVKASFGQSSLLAEPLGRGQLRRRADDFVAELNDDADVDRYILSLMDRKMPLGEIATAIQAAFPGVFKDWNAALGRVGSLSQRYSR